MKKMLIVLFIIIAANSYGQVLTLDNLLYLYNKDFSVANDYILNKKFDFIKSEDQLYSKKIIYAKGYNNTYWDEAKAKEWISINNFYGSINDVTYQHSSKSDFNALKALLISKGYKLKFSDVIDNSIIAVYKSKKYDISTSINSNTDGSNYYMINVTASSYAADSIRRQDSIAKVNMELDDDTRDEAIGRIADIDTVIHYYYFNGFNLYETPIEVYKDNNITDRPREYYMRNITKGQIKTIKFYIENKWDKEIDIKSYLSLDKCVTVKFDKTKIPINAKAIITITFDSRYAKTNQDKLYANEINIDTSIGEVPIIIYGYIK